MTPKFLLAVLAVSLAAPALAQTSLDVFTDGPGNAKVHRSGFVCPLHMGDFERDSVGQAEPATGADFCAYSALDGVYGTITLTPITAAYDPKASMAADFTEQEQTGSRKIAQADSKIAGQSVYTRTYETSKLEDLHYRVTFAGEPVNGWAVEVTAEYADPRDTAQEKAFLDAVYAAAARQIAAPHLQSTLPTR